MGGWDGGDQCCIIMRGIHLIRPTNQLTHNQGNLNDDSIAAFLHYTLYSRVSQPLTAAHSAGAVCADMG